MAIAAEMIIEEARNMFEAGVKQATRSGKRVLVSFTRQIDPVEPLAFFVRGRHLTDTAHYWSRPSKDFALAGIGSASCIIGEGAERFEQAARGWQRLRENAFIHNPAGGWGTGPLLMGGFSFDPTHDSDPAWKGFADGLLVLPRLLLTRKDGNHWLTINALVTPGSDSEAIMADLSRLYSEVMRPNWAETPSHGRLSELEDTLPAATWQGIVRNTANQIKAGKYRKVVLARSATIKAEKGFNLEKVLTRMEASYPAAQIFAVSRGEKCFAGATPERLVKLENSRFTTMALAGSIARGKTAEEDDKLGKTLLESTKDRAEHAIVVEAIREAVVEACAEISAPMEPRLLKLPNVQHLYTPITGKLADDRCILRLVESLHPTPAVGGLPRLPAMDAIRERERLDRGWYAAPVGWVNADGEGEFAVALRSALLSGHQATLFAGCGIMGDSDPESEYQEANLKMRAMLNALRES